MSDMTHADLARDRIATGDRAFLAWLVAAVLLASASIEAVVLARLSRDAVTHTTCAAQDGEQR